MKTYYTIYQITNKINGKIYIGSHKTQNLKDMYMGSGKYLNHSINKHGVENFLKEILFVFDTPEEMYAKEAELVNVDFIAEENTYNLKVGGFGGWDYVNSDKFDNPTHSLRHLAMMREKSNTDDNNASRAVKLSARNTPDFISMIHAKSYNVHGPDVFKTFTGKKHTQETKQKMSASSKCKGAGNKNSQYGTCWIHSLDLKQSKKIKKDELQAYITDGWELGRKMKF